MGDNVYARLKKRAGFRTRSFDMSGVPGKSLCLIPERFAIAMIDHGGWTLRNKIIWHKPNVMPSSIKDRFTASHEYVLFFTKSKQYYFETQYEPYQTSPKQIAQYMQFDYEGQAIKDYESAGAQDPSDVKRRVMEDIRSKFGGANKHAGYGNHTYSGKHFEPQPDLGRIMRDVWKISTQSYEEAHFATYPEKLCETPIKAGCPVNGTVIDPFMGSGTTGLVAMKLARDFIGVDVNADYCELTKKRLDPYLNQERLFD
jgi:DNA modification methylase